MKRAVTAADGAWGPGARSSMQRRISLSIAAMKRRPRGRSRPPSASRAAASTITSRQRTRSSAKLSTKAYASSMTRLRRPLKRCQPAQRRAGGSKAAIKLICSRHSSTAIIPPPASAPLRSCPTPFGKVAGSRRRRYEALWAQLVSELYQADLINPNIAPESVRLLLLGALNWAGEWYRPDRMGIDDISRDFAATILRS